MSRTLRALLAASAFAALSVTPSTIRAQASAATADSIAFPRQFVNWIQTAQGDSAFGHAGPALRESMKSAEGVNAMAMRVAARFGEVKSTDAEVQFDEGPLKVYIVVMRYSLEPQPGAWVVAYSRTTKIVERASFGPLASVKGKYPEAKLP